MAQLAHAPRKLTQRAGSGQGTVRGGEAARIELCTLTSTSTRILGSICALPYNGRSQEIDFGAFKTKTLCIPWGDISTAWRSTGIPNIEVYTGATDKMISSAKMSNYFNWLLRMRWVKNYMLRKIDKKPAGPSDEKRESGRSFLWGKVWDDTGKECISRLETVSGYSLTAKTAVLIAEKILKGNFKVGYQTPAMAYGPDLILEIESTKRTDV